jgi:hypothetical protein
LAATGGRPLIDPGSFSNAPGPLPHSDSPSLLVQDGAESRAENLSRFDASLREELSAWKKKLPLQDAQKVRPARPQRVKARGVPFGYVEGLNEARTKLAAFFSILPLERPFSLKIPAETVHQVGAECPTFRFLHVWIGKMFTNFLKAFLRLLIPLQPLGLL